MRSRQHWNGIEIEVEWCPDWLAFDDGIGTGHLQVRSVQPVREPLPISDTGYRSHFIQAKAIAARGGLEEYVPLWLEQEARSPAWHEMDAARKQMSLF